MDGIDNELGIRQIQIDIWSMRSHICHWPFHNNRNRSKCILEIYILFDWDVDDNCWPRCFYALLEAIEVIDLIWRLRITELNRLELQNYGDSYRNWPAARKREGV